MRYYGKESYVYPVGINNMCYVILFRLTSWYFTNAVFVNLNEVLFCMIFRSLADFNRLVIFSELFLRTKLYILKMLL